MMSKEFNPEDFIIKPEYETYDEWSVAREIARSGKAKVRHNFMEWLEEVLPEEARKCKEDPEHYAKVVKVVSSILRDE